MYENHHYTASPSPQFPVPQRGKKRLSCEAILRTELALEWPELVQIGRCKVQCVLVNYGLTNRNIVRI